VPSAKNCFLDDTDTDGFSRPKGKKRFWSEGVNRGFTPEEYRRFEKVISNPQHLMGFRLMKYAGLRIGEAVRLKGSALRIEQGLAVIDNQKCRRAEVLPIHDSLMDMLRRYMRRFRKEIESNHDYLIFTRLRKPGHLSQNSLRKYFRQYLEEAGLKEVIAEIPAKGRQCWGRVKNRKLYRLSTHSLRHTYVTEIYRATNNPVVTQRLARHKRFDTTNDYINVVDDDLREALNTTYTDIKNDKDMDFEGFDDPEFQEFLKFYRMWKQMKGE